MSIKEQPKYEEYSKSKKNCEFKIGGKLKDGRIISEFMGWYLVAYFDPEYKEEALEKNSVSHKRTCQLRRNEWLK